MILVDTNILSTFAKVDRLDLLIKMFGKMHISPNVFEEVKRAEELGYPHAENILAWVKDDINKMEEEDNLIITDISSIFS